VCRVALVATVVAAPGGAVKVFSKNRGFRDGLSKDSPRNRQLPTFGLSETY
jgi:hypothetical protein